MLMENSIESYYRSVVIKPPPLRKKEVWDFQFLQKKYYYLQKIWDFEKVSTIIYKKSELQKASKVPFFDHSPLWNRQNFRLRRFPAL